MGRLCCDGGDDDAPLQSFPTSLAEAHALILTLAAERAAIEAENSRIASEMATLTATNADLAAVNQAADTRIVELTAIRDDVGTHALWHALGTLA